MDSMDLRPPGSGSLVSKKELLLALIRKDLKLKYKRSILGFVWSIVTPLALSGVYLFVFIHVYKVAKPDFIFFLLTGLFPWHYFNLAVLAATTSLVENGPLIRRVYFPRFLLPMGAIGANLVNFIVTIVLLSIALIFSGRAVWTQVHWLVLAIGLETMLCVGVALALSAWNVYLRDIQQLISIVLLILFFGTPVVYELEQVPPQFSWLILSNPMTSIVETYRAALYRVASPDLSVLVVGIVEILLVVFVGIIVFRRISPNLAKEL